MKNLSIIPILLIVLFSGCQEKKETYGIISKDEKYIVGFNSTLLFEDGPIRAKEYNENPDKFIKSNTYKRIVGDTLFVSTIVKNNACMKFEPTIFIQNNKIKLDIRPLDDIRCKSIEFLLLEYVIVIPEPEKYEIIY